MAKPVKPIPDGFTSVTPYLTITGASAAIDFYKNAFGAEEAFRMPTPDGKIMHAEIHIGGSVIMLHDEMPEWNALSPKSLGGSASSIMLYVKDPDATVKRAVDAGATLTMEVSDQFYGDRCGNITDPFGHKWSIAKHIEDVPNDELARRAQKMFAEKAKK
jgi:PhnB protein